MKKVIFIAMVLFAVITTASAKKYSPMAGGGLGFQLVGDNVAFVMSAEGMVPIYNSLYARTTLLSIAAGDNTVFTFGTGTGVGLVYFFPSRQMEPYAGAGLSLTTSSGYTNLVFEFGGGAQFELKNSPIKPYAEAILGIVSVSGDYYYDDTDIMFSLMFGIRFGGD